MSTHITMLTTSRPGPALSTLNLARGVPVVLAEHGLPDLLTYTFSAPVAFESEEALAEFLDVVCDQTIEAGLFKPHTGRRGRTPKLTIDGAGWHMSGIAELRLNAQHRGHVHFSVNLNPTRWIAALPHTRVDDLRILDARTLLRRASCGSAFTLDGNDNHILAERSRAYALTRAEPLLDLYFSAVEDLFADAFVNDPALPHGMTISPPALPASPTRAEIYFEFRAHDAPSVVETTRDAAVAAMGDVSSTLWDGRHGKRSLGCDVTRNAVSLVVPLTKTVSAKLYAKTLGVVRAEIVYSGDMLEHAHARHLRGTLRTPSQTLLGLRADAAGRVQSVFEGLAMQMHATTDRKDALDLLDELHLATGHDRRRARDLLSLLANYGGVTETHPSGIAPSAMLEALERRGVLQRVRYRHGNASGGRRFALSPPYAEGVRAYFASVGIKQPPAALAN